MTPPPIEGAAPPSEALVDAPPRSPEERCRDFLTSQALLVAVLQARALGIDAITAATIADALLQRAPEAWRQDLHAPLLAALPEALDVLVDGGFISRTARKTEGEETIEILYSVEAGVLARVLDAGLQAVLASPPPAAPTTATAATLEQARLAYVLLLVTAGLEVRWLDRGRPDVPGDALPLLTLLLGYEPPGSAITVAHDDLAAAGLLDEDSPTLRPRLTPPFWHFVRLMAALDPT